MLPRNGSRPGEGAAQSVGEFSSAAEPSQQPAQSQAERIRVELVGSTRAEAFGLTITAYSPFCQICRELIRAGFDPKTSVAAFRGGTLALRTPSLRVAARLTVKDHSSTGRPAFAPWKGAETVATGAPIAQIALGVP